MAMYESYVLKLKQIAVFILSGFRTNYVIQTFEFCCLYGIWYYYIDEKRKTKYCHVTPSIYFWYINIDINVLIYVNIVFIRLYFD